MNKELTFIYNKYLFIVNAMFIDNRASFRYNGARRCAGRCGGLDAKEALAQKTLQIMPVMFRSVFQISKRSELPDIPPTQLQAMVLLQNAAGPVQMANLARELRISRQQFTKVAAALEGRGFVTRRVSPENRRMVHLHLTEAGTAYLEGLLGALSADLAQALAPYEEQELRVLLQAADILQSHLGKDLMGTHE